MAGIEVASGELMGGVEQRTSDQIWPRLDDLLAAAIGVPQKAFDTRVTRILVSIGQGMFLDETYQKKAWELAREIHVAFEKEREHHEGCLGGQD